MNTQIRVKNIVKIYGTFFMQFKVKSIGTVRLHMHDFLLVFTSSMIQLYFSISYKPEGLSDGTSVISTRGFLSVSHSTTQPLPCKF